MDLFLGNPMNYWIELQRRVELGAADALEKKVLIQEIADLRGKVSFYESRIDQINNYREDRP